MSLQFKDRLQCVIHYISPKYGSVRPRSRVRVLVVRHDTKSELVFTETKVYRVAYVLYTSMHKLV